MVSALMPERWHSLWNSTWRGLGASQVDDSELERLLARYREPHRHYHTLQHLEECFAGFDQVRSEAEIPAEIELALWYHDAVYDPHRSDNESRSAQLASEAIRASLISNSVEERVSSLILATIHDAAPAGRDAACVVDVDLGILAAQTERFDEYEEQIRAEYSWVPSIIFRRKRKDLLNGFLERPSIYSTSHFRRVAEENARSNLRRSLLRL